MNIYLSSNDAEIGESLSDLDINESSNDLEIDESSSPVEIDVEPTSSKRVRGKRNIINPKLVCALNNYKVSDR